MNKKMVKISKFCRRHTLIDGPFPFHKLLSSSGERTVTFFTWLTILLYSMVVTLAAPNSRRIVSTHGAWKGLKHDSYSTWTMGLSCHLTPNDQRSSALNPFQHVSLHQTLNLGASNTFGILLWYFKSGHNCGPWVVWSIVVAWGLSCNPVNHNRENHAPNKQNYHLIQRTAKGIACLGCCL